MKPARLWLITLPVILLLAVYLSFAQDQTQAPTPAPAQAPTPAAAPAQAPAPAAAPKNTDAQGRETIAKPMTEKQRKKQEAKLRKELETPVQEMAERGRRLHHHG